MGNSPCSPEVRRGRRQKAVDFLASAVTLLSSVDSRNGQNLRTLLGMKTRSGYSHKTSAAGDRKRAGRAATALVEEAMKY